MTRCHHSNCSPAGDVLRVGPIQLSTTWLAFGCSLLVHAGGICAFAYFSKLSGPMYLPRLQYARGETPVTLTVNFLTTAELEALSNPSSLRHRDGGEPAGYTGPPDTASPGIELDTSEHIKLTDAATTAQEELHQPAAALIDEPVSLEIAPSPRSQQIAFSSADQPNSQALGKPQTDATHSSTFENADSGTTVSPPQDETIQTALLKPLNQTVLTSFEPPQAASKEGLEQGAKILNLSQPIYPILSRRKGEEGLVLLEVEVMPDGSVGLVRVLTDPGYPRLTNAAIAAVNEAIFEPAISGCRPVRAVVKIPFKFVLR